MKIADIRAKFPQYADVSDLDLLMGLHRKYYPQMHVKEFLGGIEDAQNIGAGRTGAKFKDYYEEQVQKPMEGEAPEQTAKRLGGSMSGAAGNPGGQGMNAARNAFQGLTFGFGDEAVAGVAGALDPNGTYDQHLKAERDRLAIGRDQFPKGSLAAEIAGAIASPGVGIGVARGAGVPAKMAAGAAAGGLQGGLYGFGTGEGGMGARLANARDMGTTGALFGGAIPGLAAAGTGVVNKARDAMANSAMIKAAPTIDDLAASAAPIYAKADNAAPMPRGPLTAATPAMLDRAEGQAMDEMLTPMASRVAHNVESAATSPNPTMTYRELDILRRQAGIPSGNFKNPTEQKIGMGLVQGIDDVFAQAAPGLSDEVNDARSMWGRMKRAEMIDTATNKAGNQASGVENGVRIYLRQILNDPKKLAGFSPDEVAQMKRVVQGTLPANVLKKISKLGFGSGQQTNVLGGMVGAGAGALVSPWAAAGVPAAGYLAGKGAEAMTMRDADILRAMVLGGTNAQRSGAMTPTQAAILEKLFGPVSRGANPIFGQQ